MTTSRRSTGSSGSSSMVSWDEADDRNPSFLDVRKAGLSDDLSNHVGGATARPPTSGSERAGTSQGAFDGEIDMAPITADPRVDADVPPVPKIPSTLNLPGTWPRDVSPAPSEEPRLEQTSAPAQEEVGPRTRRIASIGQSSSSTRDRHSVRKSSRPTSRKGAMPMSSPTPKFDLGSLLAGISSGSGPEEADKQNRGSRLIRPPY